MEEKCVPSADIDSTGCHLNANANVTAAIIRLVDTTSIATGKGKASPSTDEATNVASDIKSTLQMSSTEQLLQQHLQHTNNVCCDRKTYESQKTNFKHEEYSDDCNAEGRGCNLSVSTPATDNSVTLHYKDDDSRSGSSDDITTPIVDLHHIHSRQQHSPDDDSTPTTSTHTIEVIQDHHHCNDHADGIEIYLETPVIDDQIVALNSHEYENAKPKRLSDEFLMSTEDCGDDEPDTTSDRNHLVNNSMNSSKSEASFPTSDTDSSEIQKYGDQEINQEPLKESGSDKEDEESSADDYRESHCQREGNETTSDNDVQASSADGYSFRSMDYDPYNQADDGLMGVAAEEVVGDVADNDVQSMDAIERRDFEDEHRLTGGILLKVSTLAKNNNLLLVKPPVRNMNNFHQRAVSSDSKCTYKEHSTTPTSSRHCSSRLTKSTAKINLTASLRHPEDTVNDDESECVDDKSTIQKVENLEACLTNNLHHKVQDADDVPGPSRLALAASATVKIEKSAIDDEPATARRPYELFSNSNSNDSLASENSYSTSSSHSLSHLTKQQQQQPGCSGISSASSSNPDDELKKSPAHVEIKSECVDEEVIAGTSSSARCHYASALRYIRSTQRKVVPNSVNRVDAAVPNIIDEPMMNSPSALYALNRVINSNYPLSQQELHQIEQNHINETMGNINDSDMHENEFDEENWGECDDGSDEEVCTCQKDNYVSHIKRETLDALSDDGMSKDELSSYIQMVSISEDNLSAVEQGMSPECTGQQRKRKLTDSRLFDTDPLGLSESSGRKRIAYDFSSTPRSSQSVGRRTPRALIPTRDNPPPELQSWLLQFQRWTHVERLLAVDRLIEHCEPTQVRHMMKVIEPQFQRDFISLLPRELALQVLAYLDPEDLLRAAQTCRSWRFLCDDNLLWKEKCRKEQILTEPKSDRPKRGRAGNMPPIASPWKAAYMRQHIIEMNWRTRPIRDPKVLKGHDDHVITCLQFSGNRIVSGSDDNTLKVWSAVTGRCLRTLVGHTGGVWSSQMSGNIIISGSTDRTLKVWDMETGHCIHTLMGHTSTVRCMHLHGKKVVSGSRDATLRVWDIERGVCLHVLVGHLAAVRCVQYDGKLIVSGAYDYMVKIWHPERQECLHTLQGHTNRVYSLQFDGIHVVSGSLDTSIRVWDVETGNCKHTLMGHQSLTSGMELRQNILVSGNADSTVKVWDITSGQCLQTLSGPHKHQSAVTCLQFNSRFVITSSDDGTVKLWDVKTGEFIRNLVALESGGSGGVVWRIRANDTKLICAVGSRNGTEETKLMVLDFDVEGACVKCS